MNTDNINPAHYKDNCSIECIDAIVGMLGTIGTINFCLGNCVKYLWRMDFKNNKNEDIQKASWYLDKAKHILNLYDVEPSIIDRYKAIEAMFHTALT